MINYKLLTIISGIILLGAILPSLIPLYYFEILSLIVVATSITGAIKAHKNGKKAWELALAVIGIANLVQLSPWILGEISYWIVFNMTSAIILLVSNKYVH